jgi:hypothetical protein
LGVKTTVYARVRDVSEFNSVMVKVKSMAGAKVTWPAVKGQGTAEHRADQSKIMFAWEGDTQVRYFLYELQQDELLLDTSTHFNDAWFQKAKERNKVGGAAVIERQII